MADVTICDWYTIWIVFFFYFLRSEGKYYRCGDLIWHRTAGLIYLGMWGSFLTRQYDIKTKFGSHVIKMGGYITATWARFGGRGSSPSVQPRQAGGYMQWGVGGQDPGRAGPGRSGPSTHPIVPDSFIVSIWHNKLCAPSLRLPAVSMAADIMQCLPGWQYAVLLCMCKLK